MNLMCRHQSKIGLGKKSTRPNGEKLSDPLMLILMET